MSGQHLGGAAMALLLVTMTTSAALDVRESWGAQAAQPQTVAQSRVDRTKPPASAEPMDKFTVRRLTAAPSIDGRSWIAISQVSAAGTIAAPNGQFTLTLEEASSVEVVRFRVAFSERGSGRVQLESPGVAYTFVTPDARWIISDPLDVIDVTAWRRYDLSKAFAIDPFVVLRAISSDGRRLFLSRQACPFDCRNIPDEYYEVGLPARTGAF